MAPPANSLLRQCTKCGISEAHEDCIEALRGQLGAEQIRNEGLQRLALVPVRRSRELDRERLRAYLAECTNEARDVAEFLVNHTNDKREARQIVMSWKFRACFICRERGWCQHREPEFELALIRRGD
jgi:hypothetical protein